MQLMHGTASFCYAGLACSEDQAHLHVMNSCFGRWHMGQLVKLDCDCKVRQYYILTHQAQQYIAGLQVLVHNVPAVQLL